MNDVFKALADPTRRRVLELLRKGPMNAGELSEQFSFAKPTMSAHFAVLKAANLVEAHRDGKQVIYQLKLSVLEDVLFGFPLWPSNATTADSAESLKNVSTRCFTAARCRCSGLAAGR